VHGGEQAAAEKTGHPQHVEGVRQDVVFSLEHQHEVEGAADTEGHTIGEGTLAEGVDQEAGEGCRQRSVVGHEEPRAQIER